MSDPMSQSGSDIQVAVRGAEGEALRLGHRVVRRVGVRAPIDAGARHTPGKCDRAIYRATEVRDGVAGFARDVDAPSVAAHGDVASPRQRSLTGIDVDT